VGMRKSLAGMETGTLGVATRKSGLVGRML